MRELMGKYLSVSGAPETLGVSWVTGASFVRRRQLWVGSRMGTGPQKDRAVIRSLALLASREDVRTEGGQWSVSVALSHEVYGFARARIERWGGAVSH